ncbi:muskelin [Aricia agestis]|uniref:muskelin n=1 Tax=Aricia agestis TaxID=91739 RepID=UPI001C20A48D|nr:muskelin [Aricia agestis]
MDDEHEYFKLPYMIHKYSSYSGNYKPENILVKRPTDQLSRWFTDSTTPSQFIMLKLQTTSIVEIIRFGKYMKSHVSDLKKFQVYGGLEEDNLSLLLTAGLKKDNLSETFTLRCQTSEGLTMPVNFIKIVPLQSWGPAYNYTIWYVELLGKNQEDIINSAIHIINLRKEEEAVRILLKHLRRRRYKEAFEALSRESGVQLEGPVQSRLWNALVEMGDYKMAEQIFEEAANGGELDWYMSWQPYTPSWRVLCPCSDAVEERLARPPSPQLPAASDTDTDEPVLNGGESRLGAGAEEDWAESGARPGPRGGHQLVVDPKTGTLYLFGGWNGVRDLDDLWSFDTETERWTLLCRNSRLEGGPQPRSCHKMVFDPVHGKLFTLGRYLDSGQRTPENMMSDLYSYDVATRRWRLECADTAAAGGPPLVFDHQMCIDADAQTIYVFGGRVLPKSNEDPHRLQYSGLYAYHIGAGAWRLLADEHAHAHAPQPRVSHSMLFHPTERRLYIFAGQRNREQLVDMWWWEPGGAARMLCRARSRAPPPPGFTQRATIDPDVGEIYVLSGMSASHDKGGASGVQNSLWVYSLRRRAWACAYSNRTVSAAHPRPRFAHQLVYDPVRKIHYLFGGNPGSCAGSKVRLDDLWALRLSRPAATEVIAVASRAIREAALREMAADPARAPAALHYLRNDVRAVTDIDDPDQRASFEALATLVVCGPGGGVAARALCPRRARTLRRARHDAAPASHLARHLAQVLGAEDSFLEPTQPFEEPCTPPPEEAGSDGDDAPEWEARAARIRLYERLCRYFRPSRVPPQADVMDMVKL